MSAPNKKLNCLVIGKAKTGTTALATLLKEEVATPVLHMEPKGIVDILGEVPAHPGFVTKIIFEHFRGRYRHLNAIVHNELYVRYDRVVFIRRDIRDEMVSRLLYLSKVLSAKTHTDKSWWAWINVLREKEAAPTSMGFQDVCVRFKEIFGVDAWSDITGTHTNTEREFRSFYSNAVTRDHFIIDYEDLVDDKLDGLANYLEFPISHSTKDLNLGNYAYTKRSGRYGAWRSFFTSDDVETIGSILNDKGFNSFSDWTLDPNPQLDPSEYSDYVRKLRGLPSPAVAQ